MHASASHNSKASRRTLKSAGADTAARVKAWWLAQTDDQRKETITAAAWASVAAAGLVSLFAFVPQQYVEQREAADYRQQVELFAGSYYANETPSVKVASASSNASNVSADWLSDWSESVAESTLNFEVQPASYDIGFEQPVVMTYAPRKALFSEAEEATTQHNCLATAIYYEARSESLSGQLAVAEVIMNRVADARFPGSVCDVVFQGSYRNTGCQFTFTCDGALARKPRGIRWERAQSVAAHVVLGLNEPRTGGATHYHADYVDPIWNAGLVKTETIDTHIFYRFPRGKEWPIYRKALAAKRANRMRVIQTVASTEAPESQGVITEAAAAPAP